MKIILKLLILSCVFLQTSVLAANVGVLECKKDITVDVKSSAYKFRTVMRKDLSYLNPGDMTTLIIPCYEDLNDNDYLYIKNYLKKKGKIIIFAPNKTSELKTFSNYGRLIGVNIEGLEITQDNKDINWVEKTVENNTLKKGSVIANTTLQPSAKHLAVYGDIEKHETAVSLSSQGGMIGWRWGNDADKKFNDKSLIYLLEELSPVIQDLKCSNIYINHEDNVTKLAKMRNFTDEYANNLINFAGDMSNTQENLEKSKIAEIKADYLYQTNDCGEYDKYIAIARKSIEKAAYTTNNTAPVENRGIWFDRGTLVNIKSQFGMGQYFDKLAKSGINTVYLETYNAGYSIYPSKYATQNPSVKNRDVLKWAVEEAHKRNIKVHAWLWVFAVGNDRHNPIVNKPKDYVGPVLEKNMRWALLGENGNFRPKNQPEFWIDPSNQEAVDFLISIIKEITANYAVDGIQLDYIRYPFQNDNNLMGFNHNSMEQYTAQTGEKFLINNYQNKFMWEKWKENNINNFVKKVSKETHRIRPNIKISASVFAKSQIDRQRSIQQNWEYWIKNGYIDILTPMSYSQNIQGLANNLKPLNEMSSKCLIYPGVALKHVDETGLLEQISYLRNNGYLGVTLFAFAQLDNNKSEFLRYACYNSQTVDSTYAKHKTALLLVEDYKTSLSVIKNNTYDLSAEQKSKLDEMISLSNSAVFRINSAQYSKAVEVLTTLENLDSDFMKTYSKLSDTRRKTSAGYLKRARNILSVTSGKS